MPAEVARQPTLRVSALINGVLAAHVPATVSAVIIAPLCVVLALRAATRRRNRTLTPTT